MSDEQQPKEKSHTLQVIATFFAAVASLGAVVTFLNYIQPFSYLPKDVANLKGEVDEIKSVNRDQDARLLSVGEKETELLRLETSTHQMTEDNHETMKRIEVRVDSVLIKNEN